MKTAKEILDAKLDSFYKCFPMTSFEDVPMSVFVEAMEEYANIMCKKAIEGAKESAISRYHEDVETDAETIIMEIDADEIIKGLIK